jgi:tetratricopeptide (TPR) repeat protein
MSYDELERRAVNRRTKKEEPVGFISRLFRRKAKVRPLGSQEWFQEGYSIMHSSSDYETAIRAFSLCIQLDPSNVRAFLNRGISYECINNIKAAFADYGKVIELLPEDGKAYYIRGMLLWRLGDAMAINDLGKSAELGYKPARDFLSKRASQKSPQENTDQSLKEEAIRVITESIQLDPSNASAYLNRGMAYDRINHMQQAIADYTKAIELAPDYAKAYFARGTLLWYLDDETSIRDLRKAAEMGYGLAKDFLDQNTTREQC